MSRPLRDGLKELKIWVFASPSRVKTIARGEGHPGTRAAPTNAGDNDKRIGTRHDNAETIVKDGKTSKRYKLQVNKGANNSTLKSLANKNSHEVWSYADMPVGEANEAQAVENLFGDLEKNLKK